MVDYYKFECDFYYLHYDMDDKLNGTIYRHYDNDNNTIEYIYGCNELTTIELVNKDEKKNKDKFINDLNSLKKSLNCIDKIQKDENNYLNMYDLNTSSYENYYKKLSLCHLCNDDNICGLVDINMHETIINIGMLFTFIETDKFDINEINVKYKRPNGGLSIYFNEYLISYYKSKTDSKSKSKTDSKSKTKTRGGVLSYPNIAKITTEQNFIYYETLNYYMDNELINLSPVIIEYDINKSQFFIVDGNHRVAYHIIKKFKYIPVLIIFKNLSIDFI